ncbi:Rsd/AlgQ family anti-sigma factor [Balneatrix alpica]|uniref:Rsd/AlgQ family anti-sigma factor n=1 Tax=Balneatrix alpica TaxID=75684 RepID=A0ABV5ZEU6_9GAMM|nr:Rsd/AlgQ family anti-sigma factor [Balneatrix alpica]
MLEQCRTAKERWGGVNELIDTWLHDRQDLLVSYFILSKRDQDQPLEVRLKDFCGRLVDYASKGHFEIYELLLEEAEAFNDGGLEVAATLMPKLEAETQNLLDFNDDFCTDELSLAQEEALPERLSRLGEVLEERFRLEDQLLEMLHYAHKDKLTDQAV